MNVTEIVNTDLLLSLAIFGRILSGMKIVERLGAVAVDKDDRPREDIRIRKSSVVDLD